MVLGSCNTQYPFHYGARPHRPVGLWLRRTPRKRKIQGSNPAWTEIFPGRVIPVTSKLALQWPPCQALGVIGSLLGLVGQVSAYCDWARWKVGSATFVCVAARKIVWADPSLRYTSMLMGRWATHQQTLRYTLPPWPRAWGCWWWWWWLLYPFLTRQLWVRHLLCHKSKDMSGSEWDTSSLTSHKIGRAVNEIPPLSQVMRYVRQWMRYLLSHKS